MLRLYSPPYVDRTWGIWGSCYNIRKAIFYLLKGDDRVTVQGLLHGSSCDPGAIGVELR